MGGDLDDFEQTLMSVPFREVVARRLRPVVARLGSGEESGGIYREVVGQVETVLVGLAMEHTGGNQQQAARLLGISRNTLRTKKPLPPADPV